MSEVKTDSFIPYKDLPETTDWSMPHHSINRLQQAAIKHTVKLARAGHWVDIVIRINGEYTVLQADWLKYLAPNPQGEQK